MRGLLGTPSARPFPSPAAGARAQDDAAPGRSLLAAPAFWVGGGLSMAVWAGIALAIAGWH